MVIPSLGCMVARYWIQDIFCIVVGYLLILSLFLWNSGLLGFVYQYTKQIITHNSYLIWQGQGGGGGRYDGVGGGEEEGLVTLAMRRRRRAWQQQQQGEGGGCGGVGVGRGKEKEED